MTEEQAQRIVEWAERFVAIWQEWWDRAKPALIRSAQGIRATLWQAYTEAGQPYGPTEDGMWRWFRELNERAQSEYKQWLEEQMAVR